MKKIVTILGARPQFVKAAVLSRVISKFNEIEEVIVHTGQHYDVNMSKIFFDDMNIPTPKYNLHINGLSHAAMTGQMMEKIEDVLDKEKPEAVVVYGDTNSTIAGALTAKKMNIKVIHIEAGLRSFNMKMPEEVNRILTDRISDLLLCPTNTAIENLKKEGFDNFTNKVVKSGDIMKDAVEYYSQFSGDKSSIISNLKLEKNEFVLATIHRQENTNDIENLKSIFEGLEEISKVKMVVMPLHPRTKKILDSNNLKYKIRVIDPVGYFDMMELLKNCNLVVTDSGGLQKEAFFHKKHCIIAREETEWVELVDNGIAEIVGSKKESIITSFNEFQKAQIDFSIKLYGNNVGESIYKEIKDLLKQK
ncbi:non-hydrolyzing UDP-N-acetylglucosamine 2-epimerase [Urechidicola croceus]|uniref:UDP-N-acetylglucosamine 2-epimerase n=1 Tax=Urechidicola croceus TaxID=1850246 RepID=A0A1D8PBJ4_9FLAO|nr:UDP-N-acetylglucosamine 2-epimerase (non-hydrolyzing) [Urechidicola croceus]AOW21933.1 UDP-N-acetylglucosamine 2-epimerase [Urechidicola croceus]